MPSVPPLRVAMPTTSVRTGAYVVTVDAAAHRVAVCRDGHGDMPIWSSPPGRSFLAAAIGHARFAFRRGSFRIRDSIRKRHHATAVDSLQATSAGVILSGPMSYAGQRFQVRFTAVDAEQLQLDVDIAGRHAERLDRLVLGWETTPDERFFGFGAQYSVVDMKGRSLPIWSQEQGIGRGLQPLSRMVDFASPGSAGSWHTTYTAVPFFLTSKRRGFAYEGYEYCTFDLRDDNLARFEVFAPRLTARLYQADTPARVLQTHTHLSGRMSELPDWIHAGAIVRAHGGSAAVRERVARLSTAGVPLAAVWIEDWCGTRETLFGTRLWWNWEADASLYPDWSALIAELRDRGVRVVIYFNPYLADARSRAGARRNRYDEGRRRAFLVRRANGRPYRIGQGGFGAAIIDLSNPEAREWVKAWMREEIDRGVAGWMNDFAEALPPDCVLHSGADPLAYHNRYVEEWARLAREAAREAGAEDDIVFFNRSGALRSPQVARLFWLGDQTVTWDHFDGIKTVVRGLLSSGLSGYSLNHADIGGYFSSSLPGAQLHRTRELHQRWAELAAFTAAFRTHASNEPERNQQCDSDAPTLAHFAVMARLFAALAPYRKQLIREAATNGMPLVRHLLLHHPDDPEVLALDQQFLVGADLLVAPVLDPDRDAVRLYLPRGDWLHPWSGVARRSEGEWIEAAAPIGRPAVFARSGSDVATILTRFEND